MDSNFPYEHILSGKNFSTINASEIVNASKAVDPSLIQKFVDNRSINDPAFSILIVMYSVLIIVGAVGNSLVVLAVARKPAMRTARNMFIVNLAVSDLLLCLITMPLTLVEILSIHWPLGKHEIVCQAIGTLQATSIFVSTISITAIALDRYQVIVYPTRESLQRMGAIMILTAIWLFSIFLASPMFIYRTLARHEVHYSSNGVGLDTIYFCLEEWPFDYGRAYYSAFSLFVQYLLPIVTVSIAYLRIYYKLRYRYVTTGLAREPGRERGRRMQRTNSLLIAIAVIFCISWLPLNLVNLFVDIYDSDGLLLDRTSYLALYAICHMIGMSSACSNPLLYGYFNDNFKKEFKEILCQSETSVHSGSGRNNSRRRTAPEVTQAGLTAGDKFRTCVETATTENGCHTTINETELSVLAR